MSDSWSQRRRKEASRSTSRVSKRRSRPVAAPLDVLPEAEPEVVGVQLSRDRANDLVVADQKLEVQLLRQRERVEDALVPEARPPLVHDLRLDLRDEVLR